MKRILAILCVIACLCGLCVPAMAAGTVTVHAYVPSDWTNVGAYTWEPEDFGTWPGSKMTKAADGWYEITMPGTHTTLIINSDNGQTVDITIEAGKDVWVKVLTNTNGEGKHEYEIGYSKDSIAPPAAGPSTPSTPGAGIDLSGLNSLVLVGGGIPGLPEWTPGDAAGNMNKVSNGVYTKVIAVTAGISMEIKAAGNGEWNDAYNFGPAVNGTEIVVGTKMEMVNGGGAQNFALTTTKDCNLKFTVDLTGDVPTMLVEETDEEPGATPDVPSTPDVELPEGEKITVYVQFPADWKTPAVWAWKEPGPVNATDAAWPGDLFLVKGDNGWWSVQVPNWITGLLINGNGGTVQTPDIKDFEVGKDLWINALTDPQNPVLSYEPIDVAPPAETEAPTPPVRETEGLKDNAPKTEESKGGKDLTVILAIAGAAAIIVVAVVIIVIGKGKKKA